LEHLLEESRYLRANTRTLRVVLETIENAPGARNKLLLDLEKKLNPPTSVILRGESNTMLSGKRRLEKVYDPVPLCLAVPGTNDELPTFLVRQSRLRHGLRMLRPPMLATHKDRRRTCRHTKKYKGPYILDLLQLPRVIIYKSTNQ